MKIQCSGCNAAEAKVFCCADEAALCLACDEKIHSANKQVSKHQRVSLSTSSSSSSSFPKCDICQETFGYFICLEDRAVLCRKCDVSIHTVNSSVRHHLRFLLGGVRVELESAQLQQPFRDKVFVQPQIMSSTTTAEPNSSTQSVSNNKAAAASSSARAVEGKEEAPTDSGIATKDTVDWRFKDILDLIDASPNNPSTPEEFSSKDTEPKDLANSEWLNILRLTEEGLMNVHS